MAFSNCQSHILKDLQLEMSLHLWISVAKILWKDLDGSYGILMPTAWTIGLRAKGWAVCWPSESESEVAQLCLILCDPMDCSLPGFSVYGIFQAKVVERVAISFSRGSSWTKDRTQVSHNASRCFTLWATREATNGIICPFFLVLSWWIPLTLA